MGEGLRDILKTDFAGAEEATCQFNIRLTASQKAELEDIAAQVKRAPQTILRMLAIAAITDAKQHYEKKRVTAPPP